MSKCLKCGSTENVETISLYLETSFLADKPLCASCVTKIQEDIAEKQRVFEGLLEAGLSWDQANVEMMVRHGTRTREDARRFLATFKKESRKELS